jgi:hypothetical protein
MRALGIRTVGLAAFSVLLAASAQAAPIYGTSAIGELTGSRTELLFEITTGGNYATDGETMTVTWVITNPSTDVWRYQYTFSMYDNPSISHFILDLTDDCVDPDNQDSCVYDVSPPNDAEFGTFGFSTSNPGFPTGQSITGIKFQDFDPEAEDPFTLIFFSDRAPVYGDFYIKGGSGANEAFAFNTGLKPENRSSEDPTLFIARPNGGDDVVIAPEPAVLALFGMGLLAVGLQVRRKKARQKQE